MRKKFFNIAVNLLLIILIGTLNAQSIQKYTELGDFKLESGEYILDCKVGFRTFGTLNEEKSNAILNPTWFAGTSEHLGNLIGNGPNKLLDSSKFFIIAVDAIGNGISTSPSNSEKQNGNDFPQFTIRDMVNSQYRLVKDFLKIDRLHTVIGGSMGSMQALEWIVAYPEFVEKCIAYVPTPWASTYDQLLWHTRLHLIESSLKAGVPEKEIMKTINMLTQLVARTADWYVRNNPIEKFPEILKSFDREPSKIFTSIDYAYQLRSMIGHDISRSVNLEKEKLKEHIKSKVFLIISLQDQILHPKSAIDFAELIGAKTLIFDSECGHLAVNCEMEKTAKAIAEFLDR
ncbi:MAG: alpha/beta fold hydrolase [Ignavibacteria bacterium]|nr:alpha/beta fold hydrolase [Ignavibacteria bacterium]